MTHLKPRPHLLSSHHNGPLDIMPDPSGSESDGVDTIGHLHFPSHPSQVTRAARKLSKTLHPVIKSPFLERPNKHNATGNDDARRKVQGKASELKLFKVFSTFPPEMLAEGVMKKMISTLSLAALLTGTVGQVSAQERSDRPTRNSPPGQPIRPVWESIKKRMEGAVERGDLTREQAKQKYAELKQKMSDRPRPDGDRPLADHPMPHGPEALKHALGELLKSGRLGERDAARLFQAAFGDGPPPRHGVPGDQPMPGRMTNELRETLEAARRELAEIREIRTNLERARRNQEIQMNERRLDAERRELAEQREAMEREHDNRVRELREMAEVRRREMGEESPRRDAVQRRENADRRAPQEGPRESGKRERPEQPSPEAEAKREKEDR